MNSFVDFISNCQSRGICPLETNSEHLLSSLFNFGELSSLFLFLSSHVGVDGFISNISLGSSPAWYFRVDQFELIFLGLLMLQLIVLRYIEILPINMNNFFIGDPSGRRRRRALISQKVCHKNDLVESTLKLLKKLDEGECFLLVLCQLEIFSQPQVSPPEMDYKLPEETQKLLKTLKMYGKHREKYLESDECKLSSRMEPLEEAVKLGKGAKNWNSTVCQDFYHACPLTPQDVIYYVGIIVKADLL